MHLHQHAWQLLVFWQQHCIKCKRTLESAGLSCSGLTLTLSPKDTTSNSDPAVRRARISHMGFDWACKGASHTLPYKVIRSRVPAYSVLHLAAGGLQVQSGRKGCGMEDPAVPVCAVMLSHSLQSWAQPGHRECCWPTMPGHNSVSTSRLPARCQADDTSHLLHVCMAAAAPTAHLFVHSTQPNFDLAGGAMLTVRRLQHQHRGRVRWPLGLPASAMHPIPHWASPTAEWIAWNFRVGKLYTLA